MSKLNKAGAAGAVCSVMVIIGLVLSSGEVKTSQAGLELIGNAEGCRRDPYKCPADVWTDGAGNPRVSLSQQPQSSLTIDYSNEEPTPCDWYISRYNNTISSRISANNIVLSNNTATHPKSGTQVMQVTNTVAGANHGIQCAIPFALNQQPYARLSFKNNGQNSTISVSFNCGAVSTYDQYGRPVIARRSSPIGLVRNINLLSSTDWITTSMQVIKNKRPSWATHLIIDVNSSGGSVGGYFVDDTLVFTA